MPLPTDFDEQIQAAIAAPFRLGAPALERLYRRAGESGHADAFREAIARALPSSEKSALLDAWGCRLDILPLERAAREAETAQRGPAQVWGLAISLSVVLGVIWLWFSGGKPPVPAPEVASPLFWLRWAPAAAVVILAFIGAASRDPGRRRAIVAAGVKFPELSGLGSPASGLQRQEQHETEAERGGCHNECQGSGPRHREFAPPSAHRFRISASWSARRVQPGCPSGGRVTRRQGTTIGESD
jgi:hypothetical protein